jgi:hypothetical protein
MRQGYENFHKLVKRKKSPHQKTSDAGLSVFGGTTTKKSTLHKKVLTFSPKGKYFLSHDNIVTKFYKWGDK